LLARLQGADSIVEKQITAVATNAGAAYLPFRKAELERLQAVTGLIHATLTPEARQLIMALRTNSNPDIAAAAAYVLKRRAALGDSASANTTQSAELIKECRERGRRKPVASDRAKAVKFLRGSPAFFAFLG
jgi:predicted neuraminidase